MLKKRFRKIEDSKKRLICAYLLIVLPFVVFSRSIGSDFVWDDHELLSDPKIQGEGDFHYIFTQPFGLIERGEPESSSFYRPVITLSFWLNFHLLGGSAAMYHTVNVATHVMVAVAVFFLVQLLFNSFKISVFVSLLFALHPSHVPSVSWIAGRTDVLCSLFLLAAMILYVKGRIDTSKSYLKWLSLIAFVLALGSKELACMYPAAVFIVDLHLAEWSLPKVLKKSNLPYYLSCAAILAIYLVIHSLVVGGAAEAFSVSDLIDRVPKIFLNIRQYIQILFFPMGLKSFYYMPKDFDAGTILLAIIIILLPILLTVFFRKSRAVLFGALWVVIFLFPGIGILPLNFYDVGDHLVYLPSVGFVIMLAGLLEMLSKKAFKGVRAGYAFISVAVVLAVLFSFETYRGMRFWRNDNTLFTHLAAKAPSDVIFYMLGNVNLGLENIAKAEEAYTEALKYNDKNWRVWYGLSVVAHNREDYVATRRYLNEAQLSENLNKIAYTLIFNDLGNIYYLEKDYVKAKEFYLQALRMDSTYCEAIYNLGQVYQSMGRQQDAAECFESFNSLAPSMYDKQKNKVQLYLMK